ncbi:MAG: response regulator [Desulfovibrionaceae bacterium]|nr:response regulator [Desulfovibrionaceae bacterium]
MDSPGSGPAARFFQYARTASGPAGNASQTQGRYCCMGINILVAEDDPSLRRIIPLILKQKGYIVTVAVDGADAFNKIIERSKFNLFDLLILDIQLPFLNGLDLFNIISKCNMYIPTIFMTGYLTKEIHNRLKSMNDAYYLLKPFEDNELIEKIQTLIGSNEKSKECPGERSNRIDA